MVHRIMAINTGSTSTKIAVYDNEKPVAVKSYIHENITVHRYHRIFAQLDFRKEVILSFLEEFNIPLESIAVFVGRGGLLRPIPSGTYAVNEKMLADLESEKYGAHSCNLGAALAHDLAKIHGRPAYIVDPVVVDELSPHARVSGLKEIERISIFHALNQKATAHRYAREHNQSYQDLNLIVVHLGGGISVGLHKQGQVVDVNNALGGEGPFTPERAGTLPAFQLIELCFSGKYTKETLKKQIVGKGGLVSYIGTSDGIEAEKRIASGDAEARFYLEAMGYQIIKEIGALYFAAKGEIDAVLLTGGLAHSKSLTSFLRENLPEFVNLKIYPGENEMESLVYGVLRVLQGKEEVKVY
ncbi:MAG: butyrate kinase [Acholeplasmataceae bacterium]|jgi:butyrate kinase|nr:butyrate kinase [Acholeplasmataceae bacterium]